MADWIGERGLTQVLCAIVADPATKEQVSETNQAVFLYTVLVKALHYKNNALVLYLLREEAAEISVHHVRNFTTTPTVLSLTFFSFL